MKQERIEQLWKELLTEIGEDPQRLGMKDTPARIARMYKELFCGYNPEEKPKITVFANGQDGIVYDQMIVDTGNFTSFCEHHGLPFTGTYWFGYIPHKQGNILGLSKIARVLNYHASRFQIQERLSKDTIATLRAALSDGKEPRGMALVLKAKHLCKSLRGPRTTGEMTTIELQGLFRDNPKTRQEFFSLIQ